MNGLDNVGPFGNGQTGPPGPPVVGPPSPVPEGPTPLQQAQDDSLLLALQKRGKKSHKTVLTTDQLRELAQKVIRDFNNVSAIRGIFREKHSQYLMDWRGVIEPKDEPFENAANVKVPCISYNIEQQKSRLKRAIIGEIGSNIVEFYALAESVPQEMLDENNDWFNWEMREVTKFPKVLSKILHYTLVDGFAIAIPRYVVKKKNLVQTRTFDLLDAAPLEDQIIASMQQIFLGGKVEILSTKQAGSYSVEVTNQDGSKQTADLVYWIKDLDLCCEVRTEVVIFEGVEIEVKPTEDIVTPNSHEEIEHLPFVGWRGWISGHEYKKGVADGTYLDPADQNYSEESVLASAGPKVQAQVTQFQTDILDQEEGGDSRDLALGGINKQEYGWLEIYYWEGRFPVEKEDELVGVRVAVSANTQKVLYWERLEDITGNGERSPIKFSYIEQPNRFYPIGLAEWLQHVQAALDGVVNQRLDAGFLSNFPYFFYTPAAGSPHQVLKLAPGSGYPIKDASGILFPKNNWEPAWGFREEAQMQNYAKLQSGLSDPAVGNFISKRTSATEFEQTSGAVDLRTDLIVEGLLDSVHKLLWRCFELLRRHVPSGRVFQVAGPNGEKFIKKLNRTSLNAQMMMVPNGNAQQIDPQLQRDVSVNMFQIISSPALVQAGISQPDTMYDAILKVAKHMNYKGVKFHEPDMPKPSESPEAELRRMILGQVVKPSPVENFASHIDQHTEDLTNPNLPPEVLALLQQHLQMTMAMQQQVQMMREQQALAAQQTQERMAQMGIRPGQAGGVQAGNNTGPGTSDEGVAGAPGEGEVGGSPTPTG